MKIRRFDEGKKEMDSVMEDIVNILQPMVDDGLSLEISYPKFGHGRFFEITLSSDPFFSEYDSEDLVYWGGQFESRMDGFLNKCRVISKFEAIMYDHIEEAYDRIKEMKNNNLISISMFKVSHKKCFMHIKGNFEDKITVIYEK